MSPTTIDNPALSKHDVVRILNVSMPTVDRLMASGELKYFKVGRKIVRFRAEDVAALMVSHRAEVGG
jgi:excisionase family DNA binding protein